MLIGYARVSTSGQDLAAQRDGLAALGVEDQHVHVDHGLSGTTRALPGLREALAACRAGDVLAVCSWHSCSVYAQPKVRDFVNRAFTCHESPEVRKDGRACRAFTLRGFST